MFKVAHLVLVVFVCFSICCGWPGYKKKIPNGNRVPNPCEGKGGVWHGVGHKAVYGRGPLNPFGEDFHKAHHNWADVCRKDSDGDGKTNGQELGDPDCTWTEGQQINTLPTGHPGICEPLGKRKCKRKNRKAGVCN